MPTLPIALIIKLMGYGAVAVGLLWVIDEIGDRREQKVVARHVAEEAKKAEAIDKAAREAADARAPALLPGSVARLRADWCRNCGGKP